MPHTIKTLADLFQVTTNKIRFYEKKGLLKPIRDPNNDYRLYEETDVLCLQRILLYRALGLSIDQIKTILTSDTDKSPLDQFNQLWELTNHEIHRLTGIRNTLEQVLDTLYESTAETQSEQISQLIQNNQTSYQIRTQWKDQWNFNDWAAHYDDTINRMKDQDGIYQSYDNLLDTVASHCPLNQTSPPLLLDIGIGTGNLSKRLLDKGARVIGVDQSREMLAIAKRKLPQLKVRLGDFMNLPFDNGTFQVIASTYAFHHLKKQEKEIALDEMIRVLKPHGSIVIGDMMFESNAEKKRLMATMTQEQINEVNDEFYSVIVHLSEFTTAKGLTLTKLQIDDICWVVKIEK
ncbi:hypothetical protein SANA_12040 [Gottschalkiaceae bacterium SANA]|nr:hypothetical protein SANA_12040 [Gottschalkiaceae bacterium SANA]